MTKQEIETLNLMRSHDKSATDIAIALGLSVNTVRSYIPPPSTERYGRGRVPPMWKAGHAA